MNKLKFGIGVTTVAVGVAAGMYINKSNNDARARHAEAVRYQAEQDKIDSLAPKYTPDSASMLKTYQAYAKIFPKTDDRLLDSFEQLEPKTQEDSIVAARFIRDHALDQDSVYRSTLQK